MKKSGWSYFATTPSKSIQALGCTFGGFSEYALTPIRRLELPAAAAVVLLCCGEPMTLEPALRPGSSTRLSAFAAGLQLQAQCVSHAGINDCIEIRLPPLAAYALFGGALAESNREPLDLTHIAPAGIKPLLDQLSATSNWEHRLAAVDRFLARGLAESKRRIPAELTWAWGALDRSHGQVSTRALARAVGWSERHMINQFLTYLGVRPKSAARRLRFSHAFDRISTDPGGSLSAVALETGFSDQSHMTREIKTFSGVTPSVLRAARFENFPGIPATVLLNR